MSGDGDRRLRVCLERTVELVGAHLPLRDWPGFGGPVVHLPDPIAPGEAVLDELATSLTPRYRVLSLTPRAASPFQVDAADVLAMLDQFGFGRPILAGERLGCLPALLVAAWYPRRLAGLVLIDPTCDPPPVDSVAGLALQHCPPDVPALRKAVQCPVLVLRTLDSVAHSVEAFLVSVQGTC